MHILEKPPAVARSVSRSTSRRWAQRSCCSNDSQHQLNQLTSSIHAHCSPLATNKPFVYPCTGFGISNSVAMLDPAEVSVITSGFYHLVGNAIRDKASTISNNHRWLYGRDVARLVCCVNTNGITWRCYEASNNTYSFFRHNCTQRLTNMSTFCANCIHERSHFFVWCR
jgi:hypothetical protein